MKNTKLINRRNFLKLGGGAVALTAIPLKLVAADEVSTDEPLAQAMGYVTDASTVDTAKFPKRAGDAGSKQFCNNCALYAGEADDETAPCSIFQNRLVRGAGHGSGRKTDQVKWFSDEVAFGWAMTE
mgnify:CR=1 FL=1